MTVRRLRFVVAGRLLAACLWVMPSGRLKDTLIDHVIDWRDEHYAELRAKTK